MEDLTDSTLRVTGSKQVMRALEQDLLKKAYIAMDADQKLRDMITAACAKNDVPVKTVPTMKELGKACCIEVKAAAAGILKNA